MCKVKFIWLRALLVLAAIVAPLILPRVFGTRNGSVAAPVASRKTVVVELFTSEGCSSCPPADELLGCLRQEESQRGLEIIPLGFHVDYWNSQGWNDRFSSADYSLRQQKYAERFRIEGPYTPQMVVDGDQEFVGNDASRARQVIAQAASRPALASVEIAGSSGGNLDIRVTAPSKVTADVFLAISEDNLSTMVRAGENNGRELHHWGVVRKLERVGQLRQGSFAKTVALKFEKDWKGKDLHVTVFVQEPNEGAILGAAWLPTASLSGPR